MKKGAMLRRIDRDTLLLLGFHPSFESDVTYLRINGPEAFTNDYQQKTPKLQWGDDRVSDEHLQKTPIKYLQGLQLIGKKRAANEKREPPIGVARALYLVEKYDLPRYLVQYVENFIRYHDFMLDQPMQGYKFWKSLPNLERDIKIARMSAGRYPNIKVINDLDIVAQVFDEDNDQSVSADRRRGLTVRKARERLRKALLSRFPRDTFG